MQANSLNVDIPFSKVKYNKKNNTFSVEVLDFAFIGHYGKSTLLSKILNDIHASLKKQQVSRNNIRFIDANSHPIAETAKLKDLITEPKEKKIKKALAKQQTKETEGYLGGKDTKNEKVIQTENLEDMLILARPKAEKKKEKPKEEEFSESRQEKSKFSEMITDKALQLAKPSGPPTGFFAPPPPPDGALPPPPAPKSADNKPSPPMSAPIPLMGPPMGAPSRHSAAPPPGAAPPPPGAGAPPSAESARVRSEMLSELDKLKSLMSGEAPSGPPTSTKYDINMGLQYYPVIMEQNRYLFYVYFSHEELKIEDEEGKTVYQTTITITTTKPTPPILNLRVQGEGFEVHPLSGNIEVKKDAVNPPIMIFSVLALKSTENKSKKEKKEGETRFLHVYVDFENKTVSHTVLSILVQPKFFKLKLGPINMNLSKTQTIMISIASILITVISTVYTLMSMDLSTASSGGGTIEGMIPGAGSLLFLVTFLVTLLRKGVFPIKSKVAGLLDLNKSIMLK